MSRDPHDDLTDEARLYCRTAVMAIKKKDWEAATKLLMARVKALDMALQSLTPGGSEYVGNPELCVARAKESRDTYRQLWQEAVGAARRADNL